MEMCDVLDVPSFDDIAEAVDLDEVCWAMNGIEVDWQDEG